MPVFNDLTADLDWREAELGALKILLRRPDITPTQREVLLRAAWALLYAHYEGFAKFCLTKFFDEASSRLLNCETLPSQTLAFAASSHINKLKSLPLPEAIAEIKGFPDYLESTKPAFPEVETKSNLWPHVMQELLAQADIVIDCVDSHAVKLKTLVSRRNDIAHGQYSLVSDVSYYLTYEQAVYDIMYHLAYSVEERLNQAPYSNQGE